MPFAQQLILTVPPLFLALIILVIAIVFSVGGLLVMRRIFHHQRLKAHNDIAGPIFSTLGVIYAVLLAFVVIITWENFDRANLNVEKEAGYLADLFTDCESFSEPQRSTCRELLREYANTVIKEEWPDIAWGQPNPHAAEALKKIWFFYSNYTPKNITDQEFFKESIRKLNDMCELRRIRVVESRTGIPAILWFVLIAGGTITVFFSFFFGSENRAEQNAMTIMLAVVIALILFTILEFDYPFSGHISIKPEAFRQTIEQLGFIQN